MSQISFQQVRQITTKFTPIAGAIYPVRVFESLEAATARALGCAIESRPCARRTHPELVREIIARQEAMLTLEN